MFLSVFQISQPQPGHPQHCMLLAILIFGWLSYKSITCRIPQKLNTYTL